MDCPSNEALAAYAAHDLGPGEREAVGAHVSAGCPACGAELAAIAELRRLAAADLLEVPAPWVVARAARIPADRREGRLSALAGRLADRLFDSVRDPLPRGARSAAAGARQMLCRAIDYDIDVRISALRGAGARVTGQVMPGGGRPAESVSGVEVALVGPGGVAQCVRSSELGEFAFEPVEAGTYEIVVEAEEEPIRVGRVDVDAIPY